MAAKKSSKKKAAKKKASAKKKAAPKASAKKKAAPKKAAKKAAAKKTPAKKRAPKKAAATTATKTKAAPPAKDTVVAQAAEEAAATPAVPGPAAATPITTAPSVPKKKKAEPVPEPEPEPEPELPPMPKMPARKKAGISLAYGTSADQAFMIYGLANEKVDTEDRTYVFTRNDLENLTQPASRGIHDVTSLSFGAYPQVQDRYLLLPCGAAYGDHQGPLLVARTPIRANEVSGLPVAVPSEHHTAALALRLWLPRARVKLTAMPTEHISLMIRANKIRSGVLVNEDQITYRNHNLVRVVDLGHWWGEETEGLPLAVSAMAIRRDIEEDERAKIALDLKRSIAYALGHREEAIEWALQFAGNRDAETLDKHVARYVNDLSLDSGERGRQAVDLLFDRAHRHGIMPEQVHTFYA